MGRTPSDGDEKSALHPSHIPAPMDRLSQFLKENSTLIAVGAAAGVTLLGVGYYMSKRAGRTEVRKERVRLPDPQPDPCPAWPAIGHIGAPWAPRAAGRPLRAVCASRAVPVTARTLPADFAQRRARRSARAGRATATADGLSKEDLVKLFKTINGSSSRVIVCCPAAGTASRRAAPPTRAPAPPAPP